MRLHLAFAAAVAAGCLASPASAALLARPGGYYYDTVLDITWMADANYGKTFGLSDTGLTTQQGATFLADGYVYFNAATGVLHSDWRLPTLGPDVNDYAPFLPGYNGETPAGQGAFDVGWGTPADSGIYSELGWMFYHNLEGQPRCLAIVDGHCQPNPNDGLPNTGPFANLQLGYYWSNVPVQYGGTDTHWSLTFLDGEQIPRVGNASQGPLAYAWLVHDGDIAAPPNAAIPEPATWSLLIAGFGGVGAALRRRRPAAHAAARC